MECYSIPKSFIERPSSLHVPLRGTRWWIISTLVWIGSPKDLGDLSGSRTLARRSILSATISSAPSILTDCAKLKFRFVPVSEISLEFWRMLQIPSLSQRRLQEKKG